MRLKPKETAILISCILTFVTITIFIILSLCKIYICNEDIPNAILTTAGIFIGFLISALGIYYSIPLSPEVKKSLKEQGYYEQISRNYVISLIVFFICILINVTQLCIYKVINNLIYLHYSNMFSVASFVFGLALCVVNSVNFFKIMKVHL